MRKKEIVTITANNRDSGKVFEITEMSAFNAEQWAIKCIFELINSGVEIDEEFDEGVGMEVLLAMGLKSMTHLSYETAAPLFQTMIDCARIIPDPKNPEVVRDIIDSDIEEVSTLVKLRKQIWLLHVGFFTKGDK